MYMKKYRKTFLIIKSQFDYQILGKKYSEKLNLIPI
jgi:hypothetical protein